MAPNPAPTIVNETPPVVGTLVTLHEDNVRALKLNASVNDHELSPAELAIFSQGDVEKKPDCTTCRVPAGQVNLKLMNTAPALPAGQVDARTVIFTAPSTGVYEVSSSLVQAAPELTRNGPNCCGILTFCSSISVDQPSSIRSVFLKQNEMFTMEFTSSVAGSDATIRVNISGSRDPIVSRYVRQR
jgi:hypothetical protein